jgi:hypothetical protein
MSTNNKFAKMDSIANLVKGILEADTKTKMEELKGKQHKIDMNKNNKIDAHDFAILRSKKDMKEDVEQVEEAKSEPSFRASYGLNKSKDAPPAKPTATISGKRVKGKGYGDEGNERKAPEGHASMTSLMPGHDERAAKFLARQAKGKLIKGKAQSATQKEEVELDESDLGSQFAKFVADRNANRKPGQPKITPRTAQSVIKPGGPKTPEDALKHIIQNIPIPRDVGYPKRKMNERELSEPETAEKERIVKGMKKNLAGFKKRYGERAKEVMYATATKKAKENK